MCGKLHFLVGNNNSNQKLKRVKGLKVGGGHINHFISHDGALTVPRKVNSFG